MSLAVCMFTNTSDNHFIIDLHPDHPQVSFASPCSGHGFKFASVIGEIMADLAERGTSRHNIELFRLDRLLGGAREPAVGRGPGGPRPPSLGTGADQPSNDHSATARPPGRPTDRRPPD
jgi:sarcosine oxidase